MQASLPKDPSTVPSVEKIPPIWSIRPVEWPPLNTPISTPFFQKCVKALNQFSSRNTSSSATNTTKPQQRNTPTTAGSTAASKNDAEVDGKSDTDPSNNYFSGFFMNRVLNPNTAASAPSSATSALDTETDAPSLRAPRCVAAANGWIVAVVEFSSGTGVRLVNRWNVRRGGGTATGGGDLWMLLPPPSSEASRVAHVFVDPTGSHTLLSASNGDTYYIHSSSSSGSTSGLTNTFSTSANAASGGSQLPKMAIPLPGFGGDTSNSSGSSPLKITGIPASSMAFRSKVGSSTTSSTAVDAATLQSNVQIGLTPGSYVTAVAWDKERGTEGSSKVILLGTSIGEIYEFGLSATMVAQPSGSSTVTYSDDPAMPAQPVLLHKLVRSDGGDPSEVGAAVTGLYFERLRTGLMVLAATSGRQKRTRFYTFYSAHSSSFRMVFADQHHANLQELPGSVDFADLRWCNDHFALRTQTGIYYGTIDRSLSGPSVMSGGSGSMIVDSGILPYSSQKNGTPIFPVSLALTPHHIVTLTENNEVHFINRVSLKLIQKERVDASLTSSAATLDENAMGVGEFLMDVRRPDQIWLRKGRSLIHISSSQEDRDVWKFTLEKCLTMPVAPLNRSGTPLRTGLSEEEKALEALFEQAKSLCTNATQKVRSSKFFLPR
jgi:Pep3/Vps18/deep orange family